MTSKSQAMIPEKLFCTFSLFSSHDLVISPFGNAPWSFVCNGSEIQRRVVFWHSKCELLAGFALVIFFLKKNYCKKIIYITCVWYILLSYFLRGENTYTLTTSRLISFKSRFMGDTRRKNLKKNNHVFLSATFVSVSEI